MLQKQFEHKGPFPFALNEGRLGIRRDDRTPTPLISETARRAKFVTVVRPNLKYPINFYSVTLIKGKENPKPGEESTDVHLVAMSDGKDTRYYWYSRKTRATYVANMPSRTFEEAWENLFKSVMLDDSARVTNLYGLLKHFFINYFRTLKKAEIPTDITITGNWKGVFVHLEIERMPLQAASSIMLTINGKSSIASLDTHPLVEALG